MIAIPVECEDENNFTSNEFINAQYFAFIELSKTEILKNDNKDEKEISNWLKSKNVDIVITPYIGENTFNFLKENEIKAYLEKKKDEIYNTLLKYADGELPILDESYYK